jgi:alkane 1-monooxygenase
MYLRAIKYLTPLVLYLTAYVSFSSSGWLTWLPLFYAFGFIPLLELGLQPDASNLSQAEEELACKDLLFDLILYFIVPLQWVTLFYFLFQMQDPSLILWEKVGRVIGMGLLCGTFGINVGHELGHRVHPFEKFLAKASLLTSLYMHFFIEHNKGHHKRVATPEDPSSARFGESLYRFWPRTIVFSYWSAWTIAEEERKKRGWSFISLHNEMALMHLIQAALIAGIALWFGIGGVIYFCCAALMGILLLETVNYIEHYGLARKPTGSGSYEKVMPAHSWNSNHVIGRMMLFELSRHSDHHYKASRKYQLLRHHDEAPQMPTGYPGMIILSLWPPLWFSIMNRRIRQLGHYESAA